MIFPEIAILWNVREGFEPSPPAMLPALTKKNRTSYGQLLPLHHRTPRTDYWLSTQSLMQEPLVKTCRKYSMCQAARPAYSTSLFPSLSHYSSSFFRRNQIIKDVNLILELLRQWIGEESNLTTWNNGSLNIHKLCPLCASYPFEYYPPLIFCLQGCVWLINISHSAILCDHVPDLNIDFGFLIPYALFLKPCPSPTL